MGPSSIGKTAGPAPYVDFSVGSAAAGTGLILGVDWGMGKVFPDMPATARAPLNVASFYGINALLHRAGWAPMYPFKDFAGQIPGMFSLNMASSLLVDGIGSLTGVRDLRFGGSVHDLGTMTMTLGAYYTLLGSKTAAPLLNGGTKVVSGVSWAAPAGGAGFWAGVGQGMKVVGYFGVANLLLGVGKWAYSWASGQSQTPEGKLDELAADTARLEISTGVFGEYGGAVVDGFVGHLGDGLVWVLGKTVDDEIDQGRKIYQASLKKKWMEGAKGFGRWARQNISLIIARAIELPSGEIRWSQVEKEVGELYQKAGRDALDAIYENLNYTGFLAEDAAAIKELIETDGTIFTHSHPALRDLAIVELQKLFHEGQQVLTSRAASIGALKKVGDQTELVDQEELNPRQRQQMLEQVLPLAREVQYYSSALELLQK
jgi:hypothetical protein